MQDPDLITAAQAAVIIGVSTRTVQRLQASGKLGFAKIGGQTYFSRLDVQEYLAAQWQKPKDRRKSKAS